ncbi:MAG TPA: ISL3 family transposase, partial [Candidatus Sulfotelmatobacter sp.]
GTSTFYPFVVVAKQANERKRTEVLIETFIRKQLRLKAHRVTKVETNKEGMTISIDRMGNRLLRCGVCGKRCLHAHSIRKEREWRDLSMRQMPLILRYQPRRVECVRCGVRVEGFPWAEPWARVTRALSHAVARLARELSWQGTARQYGLNWKTVAGIVKRAVRYGLRTRKRPPVHVIGIDEVSRRKGQVYLTVVYDLERRVLLWVGEDRTEEAVKKFFTEEMGRRRCSTLQVVCMDMWAAYMNLVKQYAPQAQILFDRFHIVKHLQEAVDEVRRTEMRRLSGQEKVTFKRSRWLLLKNPWNLTTDQKERLSTLVRWNTPIVRAYYLKESFQLFWEYRQEKRAEDLLSKWMRSAMRSRLEPFKRFVKMLRSHLDGILPWTKLRLSNGAVEGMNNKIKSISHRSFGFRSSQHFIAAIYHCCAKLPLPVES